MYIRPVYVRKNGKRHAYWALVESYRTDRGPRQRVVAYLGQAEKARRKGVRRAAQAAEASQGDLYDDIAAEWVEVDTKRVRSERVRAFGGPWLGLALMKQLDLPSFLNSAIPTGREEIEWPLMAAVLVLCRLCDPSSELSIAEHGYGASALPDLLGIPPDKVNDDRLYRTLDVLLPHKQALEKHLKTKLGELFDLKYDLLLYDVTSTYFEGAAAANPLAQRGYSRDSRPDCKQVCIGLVVSRCGMPLGYEVFAGNRHDSTTVEHIVQAIESRYGQADRIWAMDRGMVSEDNVHFLRQSGRRYILGTPKSLLKKYEQHIVAATDWQRIRDGLEVKLCPVTGCDETFILCRSRERGEKEKAIHARFAQRIEQQLVKMQQTCRTRKQTIPVVERRIGRLLERNSRGANLFDIRVTQSDGRATIEWSKNETQNEWADLSDGCYILRTNVTGWTAQELWQAYIQLTQAEHAFRIHKSDLDIRPIWHQTAGRVQAHIFVCFLAYVLWKTLEQLCRRAGLGDEPRRIFSEIANVRSVDIVLPTRDGREIRKRCVVRPTEHQAILLQRLGLRLPSHLKMHDM